MLAIGNLAEGGFKPLQPLDIGMHLPNVCPLHPIGRRSMFLICSRSLAPHLPQLRSIFSFHQDLEFPLYFLPFFKKKKKKPKRGGPVVNAVLQLESRPTILSKGQHVPWTRSRVERGPAHILHVLNPLSSPLGRTGLKLLDLGSALGKKSGVPCPRW